MLRLAMERGPRSLWMLIASSLTLPSAKAAFCQLFLELGEKNQLPSPFHCTTGKGPGIDKAGLQRLRDRFLTVAGKQEE